MADLYTIRCAAREFALSLRLAEYFQFFFLWQKGFLAGCTDVAINEKVDKIVIFTALGYPRLHDNFCFILVLEFATKGV